MNVPVGDDDEFGELIDVSGVVDAFGQVLSDADPGPDLPRRELQACQIAQ